MTVGYLLATVQVPVSKKRSRDMKQGKEDRDAEKQRFEVE